MASRSVPDIRRRPTRLVRVGPGLWVAQPTDGVIAETLEERLRRRFEKRAVFARPLVPRVATASAGPAAAAGE